MTTTITATFSFVAVVILFILAWPIFDIYATSHTTLNLLRRFMSDFENFRKAVDAETTRIATQFEALLAKANTPQGLSPAEQAEADASIAALKKIGNTSEPPVAPPAVTPPTVEPAPIPPAE